MKGGERERRKARRGKAKESWGGGENKSEGERKRSTESTSLPSSFCQSVRPSLSVTFGFCFMPQNRKGVAIESSVRRVHATRQRQFVSRVMHETQVREDHVTGEGIRRRGRRREGGNQRRAAVRWEK